MKRDFFVFSIGLVLGYLLVQGMVFMHHQFLWALFYH